MRERVSTGQTKELSVFDLNISKLLILAVIALVIFGPNELPKMAAQAGRALRDLRRVAEGAKNDLREGLGPEFADFEIEDLNPKRFVQKHFLDDLNGDAPTSAPQPARANGSRLAPGERPPFDSDAT
jgi:sec-independent protein translocase protein TatB